MFTFHNELVTVKTLINKVLLTSLIEHRILVNIRRKKSHEDGNNRVSCFKISQII
jgi:hypothetical protein